MPINLVPPSGAVAETTLEQIIQFVITLLFIIGIISAIVFLIYGGIRWIISGGNKEKVEAARSHIVASIVGLVIIVAAFLIFAAIFQILGARNPITEGLCIPTLQHPLCPTPTPTPTPTPPPCITSGGVCIPNYPCGLGYEPSTLSCGGPEACCVLAPTPTPTPVPACPSTEGLSISCPASVETGAPFTISYTYKDAGLNSPFKHEYRWLERTDIGYINLCHISEENDNCATLSDAFNVIAPSTAGNYTYTIHGFASSLGTQNGVCGFLDEGFTQSCSISVVNAPTP